MTVFKIFGLEICNFKQWNCDILERNCIVPIPKTTFRNRRPIKIKDKFQTAVEIQSSAYEEGNHLRSASDSILNYIASIVEVFHDSDSFKRMTFHTDD